MPREPGLPDETCDSLIRGSFLTASVRRDVADLNRQFLELGLSPDLAGDARFAWSDPVRCGSSRPTTQTRARMAACPFTFFELLLPPDRQAPSPSPGAWRMAAGP